MSEQDKTLSKVILLSDLLESYLYDIEGHKQLKFEIKKITKQSKNLRRFIEPIMSKEMQLTLGIESDELKEIIEKFANR